jgi:hypothetical protein
MVAGGWSVFWNELLNGAPRNRDRSVAALVTRLGDLATARSTTAQWFKATFPHESAEPVVTASARA